jgi:hypothetical protein
MRATVAWALLAVAGAVPCSSQQQQQEDPLTAFHDAQPLTLRIHSTAKGTPVKAGPWHLGTKVRQTKHGRADKISDKRLNLYFIVPGTQHQSKLQPEFDHNLMVNIPPPAEGEKPIDTEADLFWVAVLDPRLSTEIRTESDLILLAQERFTPNDLYSLDDSPSATLLRENAKIDSIFALARFRDENGNLPRILILPANAILAVTIDPQ